MVSWKVDIQGFHKVSPEGEAVTRDEAIDEVTRLLFELLSEPGINKGTPIIVIIGSSRPLETHIGAFLTFSDRR